MVKPEVKIISIAETAKESKNCRGKDNRSVTLPRIEMH